MRYRTLEIKDTNPKDAVGIRKAPMSAVPAQPLLELGLAMMEGARKYGRHNYRIAGVRSSVYYDAVMRHIMAWWEGEDIDPDSGLPHLVKAMACLCVLRDSFISGNVVDDRPPALQSGWQVDLNKKASDLIDRLPNSKDAYLNTTSQNVEPETGSSKAGSITWVERFDRELLQTILDAPTTPSPHRPSSDSPAQLPLDLEYTDPKNCFVNQLGGWLVRSCNAGGSRAK
jgi:hypothetical protein